MADLSSPGCQGAMTARLLTEAALEVVRWRDLQD